MYVRQRKPEASEKRMMGKKGGKGGVRRIGKRPFVMLHPSLIKREGEFPRTKKMNEAHHGKQNSKQPPVAPLFL